MPPTGCPTRDELVAFHGGRLDPAAGDRVAAHLESCAGCEAILQELDDRGGTIDEALRATPDATWALPPAAPGPAPAAEGRPGALIAGRYRLVEGIGEGGMGAVFRAEQVEPVRRAVALKLIKPGMDSRQVLARFEAERQALALMDHPNIAKILDAGETERGRPFFAMELVAGPPIVRYCDERRLTPERRLELFIVVCRAVQHAHQKGIIHRDLKPSNVLVAEVDGRPVPKVIDFGIAKATGAAAAAATRYTGAGMVVGTPEYMAPEQAGADPANVDTRADVYALGVLLYELLTGSTPLTRRQAGEAGLMEVLRLVREEDPPLPSSRLAGGDALPTIAANRGLDPRRLASRVRGDLDWVVMKALEKDRGRRYETADALARDVRRHLDDDPVEAGRPSAAYRLRKFARRHRTGFRVASAFVALLVATTAVSLQQAARASRERDDKQKALGRATEGERKAREELENRDAVLKFFVEKVLAADRPRGVEGGLGPDVTVRQAVAAASVGLGEALRGRPAVEAAIRQAIGHTLTYAGRHQQSVAHYEEVLRLREAALGFDHPDTLWAANDLAGAFLFVGRRREGIDLMRRVLDRRAATLGPDHDDTISAMTNLAAHLDAPGTRREAIALFERALPVRIRIAGPDGPDTLLVMTNLGNALRSDGRVAEATRMHEEALRRLEATVGPGHVRTLICRVNLARDRIAAQDQPRAVALLEPTVPLLRQQVSGEHPAFRTAVRELVQLYRATGRPGDAARPLQALVEAYEAAPPAEPLLLAAAREDLARAFLTAGRPGDAVVQLEAAAEARRVLQGPDQAERIAGLNSLADALARAGRPADSLGPLREAARALAKSRAQSAASAYASIRLTEACLDHGSEAEALATLDQFLATRRALFKPESRRHAIDPTYVAWVLVRHGRFAAAEPHARLARAAWERLGDDDWLAHAARSVLGGALLGQGRAGEAEPLLVAGYAGLKAAADQIPARDKGHLPEAVDRLIQLARARDALEELAKWQRERATYPAEVVTPSEW